MNPLTAFQKTSVSHDSLNSHRSPPPFPTVHASVPTSPTPPTGQGRKAHCRSGCVCIRSLYYGFLTSCFSREEEGCVGREKRKINKYPSTAIKRSIHISQNRKVRKERRTAHKKKTPKAKHLPEGCNTILYKGKVSHRNVHDHGQEQPAI